MIRVEVPSAALAPVVHAMFVPPLLLLSLVAGGCARGAPPTPVTQATTSQSAHEM
jgi:hypothetical protein